jgi:WD40 repeat protein
MADVFISYSRRDTEFVRRLHERLAVEGRDTWVDWEDIPASADWWREVCAGIESADAFVFVISPDSIRSDICRRETEHAVANNKRLIPILQRPIEATDEKGMHPSISTHNWIFFRNDDPFDKAFSALLHALDTDLSHVRQHTRLLVRAKEWQGSGQNNSFLLQGDDLIHAEDWLAEGVAKRPPPSALHAEYINASRDAARRRQRTLLAGVTTALVVALGLALLSFVLYGESNRQRGIAEEKSITATVAQGQAIIEADNAQTQAAIALNNAATATVAQGEAQIQAEIARREAGANATAQAIAQHEARNAATQAAIAQNEADNAATQAAIALFNAATATVAQGEAQIQADNAQTQAAIAQSEANANATAQAVAQNEANNAATQAVIAQNNAATATIAQGEAQIQAQIARTQAAIALDNAATATVAQGDAQMRATAVADERNRAQSIALAGQAQIELNNDSARAVLIALYALQGYPVTWQAERALGIAIQGELPRFEVGASVEFTSVDWSPSGDAVLTADNGGTLLIVNGADGGIIRTIEAHSEGINRALWSLDGARIATASTDDTARLFDVETGRLLFVLTGHGAGVNTLDWSPDGARLATGSNDNNARIWNTADGDSLFILTGHVDSVNGVEWSPDGASVVTASDDATAKVWDAATGDERFTLSGHSAPVLRALWSSDGDRILTISSDTTAKVWNAATGAEVFALVGHSRSITRAAWSPDGSQIVTVSEDDTAKIWDAATGELKLVLYGHTNDVGGVAWSPDGSRLVTTGDDQTVRVWNAESGAQLLVFNGHRGLIYSVGWSSDGGHIATASADGTARLWGIWKDAPDLVAFAQNCCVTRVLTDEESSQFGVLPAPSASQPDTIVSCSGALPSRLYPGVRARVTADGDDRALNVRSQPGLGGAQIGQISPDKTFWVTGDPDCVDGIAWFPIIYGINAGQGWIAEGEAGVYFVEPVP